jgi:PAS domain S-box-containing protein
VAITDQAGRITYVNDTFCSVSGYDRGELLGQTHRVLKSGYHTPEFFQDLWRTISNGRIWQGEIRNRAKDGSHYWLNTTIAPMFNRKGRIRGYIALRTDITARKEAELELQSAKDKAEFANQAKSEFLAHMSHELRTPLNAIIGFAEIILDGAFGEIQPPRYKDYLSDLHASARLLLDLINNVLDVSKIEAGEMTAEPEPTELAPIIRRTIRMLEQRATAKNITLQSDLPKAELIVHADLRHVRQILQNLLTNAVKYTETGGLVTLRARERDGQMIAIEVIDNGVGIPENEIQTVMQPFAQATTTRHGVQEGTGLGLPLSHRLTKMNGGDMWIDSVEGEGTTVTAILPAYIEDENEPLWAPTLDAAAPS